MKNFLKYAIFAVILFVVIVLVGRPMIEKAIKNVEERQNNESFYDGNMGENSSDTLEPEENLEDVDTSIIQDGAGVGAVMEPKDPVHTREVMVPPTEEKAENISEELMEGIAPFLENEETEQSVEIIEEQNQAVGEQASPVCYFVQYDSGVSAAFAARVEGEYVKVPENVRVHFQTGGWRILVSYENLAQRIPGYGNSILAFTDSDVKTIFIDNREKAVKSVVHEMGHYIDWVSNLPSESEEFARIYREEVSAFCSIHSTHSANTSTPMEYFAEFYEVMIYYPESAKTTCPQTYEFVQYYQSQL